MVISKARQLRDKIKNLKLFNESHHLTREEVGPALAYIDNYWKSLVRYHPNDEGNLVGLPNKFIVPSFARGAEFDYNEQYYWDSYFIIKGLLNEKYRELNIGMLDNLIYMFERFRIIPNASRLYLTSRSHPPLLSSLIFDIYDAYKLDKKWLASRMPYAEQEYNTVWMGRTKPNVRVIYKNLSRYYDFNYLNDIAETESGWDMTPRFYRKALNFLPIDLSALLYKYEMDFSRYYEIMGDVETAKKWKKLAHKRRENTDELMWSNTRGLYYDYNFERQRRGSVGSLASYYPMWMKMTSNAQAEKLVKSLRKFEHKGGLATTELYTSRYLPIIQSEPTQWAYPNGWAPLHFIVTEGLSNYGYHEAARRIAVKWLKTNLSWFAEHGVFLEKYNVVNPKKPPEKGLYPSQTGFGWTNSIFVYLANKYLDHKHE